MHIAAALIDRALESGRLLFREADDGFSLFAKAFGMTIMVAHISHADGKGILRNKMKVVS